VLVLGQEQEVSWLKEQELEVKWGQEVSWLKEQELEVKWGQEVSWLKDPALKINSYMRFLESSGWQFGYGILEPGFIDRKDSFKFFYTSNLSIKKHYFDQEQFDENFKVYGWEDTELGYRLFKNHSMRLFYEPSARAYHYHLVEVSDLTKKMRAIGKSAVHFERLQPEVRVVPTGPKKALITVATQPLAISIGRLFGKKTYYQLKSWKEFMRGVKRG